MGYSQHQKQAFLGELREIESKEIKNTITRQGTFYVLPIILAQVPGILDDFHRK